MAFGELMDILMVVLGLVGLIAAFRYMDGRAKARKKFRKPKYKQFKID